MISPIKIYKKNKIKKRRESRKCYRFVDFVTGVGFPSVFVLVLGRTLLIAHLLPMSQRFKPQLLLLAPPNTPLRQSGPTSE